MKKILLTLLTLPLFAQAQYREVSGDFFPNAKVEKSYLVNGFFEKNTNAVTATTHTAVRNTSSPIQGAGDLQITASAAGNTRINTLAWEKRLEGQNCELSFKYVGGGGTWSAQIWDGSLNVLVSRPLPAVTLVSPVSINYPCGSLSGRTIRFVTTASAPQLNVDELYYGMATNIVSLNSMTDWVPYTPTGSWTGNVTYTGEYRIVGDTLEVRAKVVTSAAPTPAATALAINIPPQFQIDTGKLLGILSTDAVFGTGTLADGSNGYKVYPVFNNNTSSIVIGYQSSVTALGQAVTNTTPFTFGAGDFAQIVFTVPIVGFSATQQAVTQQCIQDGSCENVFSAYITTTGTVLNENIDWINGNCTVGGSSTRTCTFNTNFFAGLAPKCVVSSTDTAAPEMNVVPSGTGFVANTLNSAGAGTNRDFMIICHRNVGDYRPRFAAPILTGSVTSNSASAERIERLIFGGPGNSACTVSPCTILSQSGNWISSVTRSSAGSYVVNFNGAAFSSPPTCISNADFVGSRPIVAVPASATTSSVLVATYDPTATAAFRDSLVYLFCFGPRLQ